MAIGYLNVAIIGRSSGRSAVAAAAYASRSDLVDERTGTAYRYARKSGDIVTSFLWLPKDAPEYLRDRATLWNQVEKAENRKNSQTARRIIMGLPHELTEKQQQQLLQDFVRENFTRKGLAVDASIHAPDPNGDDRNHHAHLLIPTRFMDKNGLGKKDRVSNDQATGLGAWKASWVKLANRQLERYGHAARITFEVAEGQTAQKHMGPQATALERQGVETRAGDDRLEIITDNMQPPANDNVQARSIGSEFELAGRVAEIMPPVATPGQQSRPANDNARQPVFEPEAVDRDLQNAEWQDALDKAAIAYADQQRQQLRQSQADTRTAFEGRGEGMSARHAVTWTETAHRHAEELAEIIAVAPASYQTGTMAEAEGAATGSMSFLLGLFASWAESITRSVSGAKGQPQTRRTGGPDRAKERERQRQAEQLQEAHSRELEAMLQEQARERESYERRRAQMLFEQAGAMQNFEQEVADKSSLREAFDRHTESLKADNQNQKTEQTRGREPSGPELSL